MDSLSFHVVHDKDTEKQGKKRTFAWILSVLPSQYINYKPSHRSMSPKIKGYLFGSIAASTYGMNPLFALPLYAEGMDPDSVLFFRYLFAIPVLGLMLRLRGRSFRIARGEVLPLASFGLLFSFSSLFLFQSYNHMDAGIASTLLFVYPIMVAVIMAIFFGEKLGLQTVLCIVVASIGIGLLYKGDDGATLSFVGTILVAASSLSYAVYLVGVNHSRLKSIPTIKVTFYVLLFGWGLFAVRALTGGGLQMPPADKWYLWGNLFALGLLPTAISLLCTTAAILHIGSTPTAILGALEPVTAVFIGVTVFNECLTMRVLMGLALIVCAVTMVVAGGNITSQLVRIRKMFPSLVRHKNRN